MKNFILLFVIFMGQFLPNVFAQQQHSHAAQAVTSFTLINADTDQDIGTIANGDIMDIAALPTPHLNIRANVNPAQVGSVVFEFDGRKVATENTAPYAIGGDYPAGNYQPWNLSLGEHTLTATPYSKANGKGQAGEALQVYFRVEGHKVESFTLINADTDQDIGTIANGDVIDIAALPTTHLNIRANVYPAQVGSVVFEFDGRKVATENTAPYAIGGDYPAGNYQPWDLPLGEHTLIATAHTKTNGYGLPGKGLLVHFRVGKNMEEEEEKDGSAGELAISGVSESTFNPLSTAVNLKLTNATFSADPRDYRLYINEEDTPLENLLIGDSSVTFHLSLKEGRNHVLFTASDHEHLALAGEYVLWAGSQTLPVQVVDENNAVVSGALVTLSLSDDPRVGATATATGEGATFLHVPQRTIIAAASAPDTRYGTAAIVPFGDLLQIHLNAIKPLSATKNLDFSQGTAGWDLSSGTVSLIPHEEETSTGIFNQSAPPFGATFTNNDLQISTMGQGPKKTSHVFTPNPDTKSVTVRYRFITSEVPGGYFGSQYNDYFSIVIHSQKSGTSRSETNSMNGLGLAAFHYATGATGWREVTIPITSGWDVIQIDALVANIGDGAYDSRLVIELVEEGKLAISQVALFDIDKSLLRYVSLGDGHSYLGGKTQIFGAIEIEGEPHDQLTSLELEVLKDGQLVTTGTLAASVKSLLLQPFGEDGKVEVPEPMHLFDIPAISSFQENGKVQLRVKARSEAGQQDTKEYETLPYLAIYPVGEDRYGKERDAVQGGDSWALPSVVNFARSQKDWTYNDFSNMNGGKFDASKPGDFPHAEHKEGIDIDFRCPNWQKIDAQLANTLLAFLNSPAGQLTQYIYVTYSEKTTPEFFKAIQDTAIANLGGKLATDIIQYKENHEDHFHIRLKAGAGAPGALMAASAMPFARRGPRVAPPVTAATGKPAGEHSLVSPNPVVSGKGQVQIAIQNPKPGKVTATVYNMDGVPVKTILDQQMEQGQIKMMWDGLDENGRSIAPGIYLLKIYHPSGSAMTHRILVL